MLRDQIKNDIACTIFVHMSNKLEPLQAQHTYHIFNRTNGKEKLFTKPKNYQFFLDRYKIYIHPFVNTYAYCLLPDHFHLSIQIKSEEVIKKLIAENQDTSSKKCEDIEQLMSQQFRRLFLSYSKAYNQQENRNGSLFQRPFKRKMIHSEAHFSYLCFYIHYNAQKHGWIDDFRQYPWSSYQAMLSNRPTLLKRQEVLDWYGGKEEFINYHNIAERNRQEAYLLDV